jgi:geranylgeranyl reductase family protein
MSENGPFDVLIIGAGPAGSFAAEKLALGGARVALFDGRDPGDAKACGGGVTSKALKAWPFLLDIAARLVTQVEMHSPAGTRIALDLPEPFAIYSRRALDTYLCERARDAGAHVFQTRVTASHSRDHHGSWKLSSRDGRSWNGKLLVGADGANSPVARRLAGPLSNSEMEVAFGYRTPLKEFENVPTVIAFLPGWAGYAWAFPRLDHISFGIATTQDGFDHKKLDSMLWEFMVGYYRVHADKNARIWPSRSRKPSKDVDAAIKERLTGFAERYAARIPGLAPETLDSRRAVGDGWALVGDAAGFADPVTGEGIYYGMRSAELFAEAFLRGDVSEYEQDWRDDFGKELRRASQMRRRFYGRFWGGAFTDRMITFARAHRGIRRTLRELVAGDQGYIDLKRALARRAAWPL